jgi:hypothetical protein
MTRTRPLAAPLALLLALALTGCGQATTAPAPEAGTASARSHAAATTDYSDPLRWAALPRVASRPVDVFFLGPTEYRRPVDTDPVVGPVDDAGMMLGIQSALRRQASAFAPSANIYSPLYRQADAASRTLVSRAEQDRIIAGAPTADGIAAFDYYLKHYNHGRPFILAGHSQGSLVLANVLADYIAKRPAVQARMVAAYLIGASITQDYIDRNPTLQFATGADDTGVIVSWNTEASSIAGTSPITSPGSLAINPITWTRSGKPASADENLGSEQLDRSTGAPLLDANGDIARVVGLADARVDARRGVVVCSSPWPAANQTAYPRGVYHSFDYSLYYFDVRANAADRIAAYFGSH